MVELATVLVIASILSTMAVVGYRRWVNSSRMAEVNQVFNGVAQAQEARKAETGSYVNISGTITALYPAANPGPFKTAWGGPCGGCLQEWSLLAFAPDAPVAYGYSTIASSTAVSGGRVKIGRKYPTTGAYYTIMAKGDPDGDGVFASAFMYSDEPGDIILQNEGD